MSTVSSFTCGVKFTGSVTDSTSAQPSSGSPSAENIQISLTHGTGAAAVNRIVAKDLTIAGPGSATMTLSTAGALTDALGVVANFTIVRVLSVVRTAGTGSCSIGGANNTFAGPMGSATTTLKFNKAFEAVSDDSVGYPVTATTGDKLVFTYGGSDTATLRVGIAGEG